jgi:hypothetical protein
MEQHDSAGPPARSGGGLSRRGLLTASGGALVAGGVTPLAAFGNPRATPSKLEPREAARLIADVLGGRTRGKGQHHRNVLKLAHHLADRTRGAATIEKLLRAKAPTGVKVHASATASPPTDRFSAAKYWWGYTVFIPHDPLVAEAAKIVNWVGTHEELVKQLTEDFEDVCEEVEEICPYLLALVAYILAEIDAILAIDIKYGTGARLSMSWAAPGIFVPSKF